MTKKSLFSIFLVFFLDYINLSVVFPLFSSLILSREFDIVPFSETLSTRTFMLGMLNAAFPLALLIGAPVMGSLSDHFGRRRTFLATVSAATLGNLATGIAIYLQNYTFLIFSRVFSGFFSGNLTLCLASISDISPDAKTRAKNLGSLAAVGGLSWLIAVLIGGDLSVRAISPSFSPPFPFWIVSGIGLLNLIILYFIFPETHLIKHQVRLGFASHQILHAIHTRHLRQLFLVQFFCVFSWMFIFQWFSAYSIEWYHLPRDVTGISLSVMSLCWVFGVTVLNRFLIRHLPLKKIPLYNLFLITLLFLLSSYFSQYVVLVALDCLKALIVSLTISNLFNLISLAASTSVQGKVLGLTQSFVTVALFAASFAGSFMPVKNVPLFYQIAALSSLIAFLLYFFEQRKTHGSV